MPQRWCNTSLLLPANAHQKLGYPIGHCQDQHTMHCLMRTVTRGMATDSPRTNMITRKGTAPCTPPGTPP